VGSFCFSFFFIRSKARRDVLRALANLASIFGNIFRPQKNFQGGHIIFSPYLDQYTKFVSLMEKSLPHAHIPSHLPLKLGLNIFDEAVFQVL